MDSTEREVIGLLFDGPRSINSIMTTTGLTRQEVMSTLRRLKDAGKVSSAGFTWTLFREETA